jgi:hypothetical protein
LLPAMDGSDVLLNLPPTDRDCGLERLASVATD